MKFVLAIGLFIFAYSNSLANNEYALYKNQGSRCTSTEQGIVLQAFNNYNQWKNARDTGRKSPKGLFKTIGQQFSYIYNNGCNDGLIIYRYGNLLRHNKMCNKAIPLIKESLDDLKNNYPSYLSTAYYVLGFCTANLERYADSIKFYEKSIQFDPNNVDSNINLAYRYYWGGQKNNAQKRCHYVLNTLSTKTSQNGKNKCIKLIEMIKTDK